MHKYFKKRGKMHEGLKNGKNDYKWRFVLNRCKTVISLANGGVLSYNTIKSDVKTGTKVKQFIWAALGIVYVVFIVMMQLYCFWKL